jgi:hypothetical protein
VLLEILPQEGTDLAIVIYDQQVRTVVHRASRITSKIPKLPTVDSEIRAVSGAYRTKNANTPSRVDSDASKQQRRRQPT